MWKSALSSFFVILLAKCSDDASEKTEINCATVLCTQEFVTLSIRVQDKDGVQIPLDDFQVIDLQSGKRLNREYPAEELALFRQEGSYPLYDDSFRAAHQNEERHIVFSGSIRGEKVVEAPYVVFADCCHVSLLSGEDPLTP